MGKSVSVRRWTITSIDCYERGCVCEGCFYNEFFSPQEYKTLLETNTKCQMKASVLELVRLFGIPEGMTVKTIIEEN